MLKTSTIAYALLLVVAFVIGVGGTLAASGAVLRMRASAPPLVEQPASTPTASPLPALALTIEC